MVGFAGASVKLCNRKVLSIILLSLSLSLALRFYQLSFSLSLSLRFDQLSHSLSLSLSNKKEIPTLDASAYISLVISALQFGPSDRQQVKLQQHQRSLEHTTKLT